MLRLDKGTYVSVLFKFVLSARFILSVIVCHNQMFAILRIRKCKIHSVF